MTQDNKFDFSHAVKEIEEINNWFQNEDIDLGAGLEKFKKGLELIKKCKTRLKQVENEFIEIKKEYKVDEKQPNLTENEEVVVVDETTKIDSKDVPF